MTPDTLAPTVPQVERLDRVRYLARSKVLLTLLDDDVDTLSSKVRSTFYGCRSGQLRSGMDSQGLTVSVPFT